MPIKRGNPFDELENIFNRMSREFEGEMWGGGSTVPVDVEDAGDRLIVTADLPGFTKDEIDVSLLDTMLRIEADRDSTVTREETDYIRQERRRSSISRSVSIPEPVDESAIKATYKNGVLEIEMPKVGSDDSGKQIDIE